MLLFEEHVIQAQQKKIAFFRATH